MTITLLIYLFTCSKATVSLQKKQMWIQWIVWLLSKRLKEYSTKELSRSCLSSEEAVIGSQKTWIVSGVSLTFLKHFFCVELASFICLIIALLFLKGGLSAWLCFPLFARVPVSLSASNTLSSPSSDPLVHSKPLSLYTLLISLSSRTPRGVLTLGLARE